MTNPVKTGEQEQAQNPKATYQVGTARVLVWERVRKEESGDVTVKSFEIENILKRADNADGKNQFDATELLQLKADIDKAINEENVKTIQGTNTDTTKTNKE